MERQLRGQEEFRRHLLESFPDLILVLDLKGSTPSSARASANCWATARNTSWAKA